MTQLRVPVAVTLLALAGCGGVSPLAPKTAGLGAAASPAAVSESVVHNFTGSPDGAWPYVGRLVADRGGNLYGATISGGSGRCRFRGESRGCGVVFELVRAKSGQWSERVLYGFKNVRDGAVPRETLAIAPNGTMYGVTMTGGNRGCTPPIWNQRGCGAAFELARTHGQWRKRTIHLFSGNAEGGHPSSNLVMDSSGNLYGTTLCGGAASCVGAGAGAGVFFMLQKSGSGAWRENVLHIFGQTRGDGAYPDGDITPKGENTIYGTNAAGVYAMTRTRKSQWRETMLFLFPPYGSKGFSPEGGLVFDDAGNLYGATYGGGKAGCNQGCGVVFELTPSRSGAWSETLLYEFSGESDGAQPGAGLAMDAQGRLLGTTINGGNLSCNAPLGCGVVFRVRPAGSESSETVLHAFQGGSVDGYIPLSAVTLDSSGAIYGTTQFGGSGTGFANGIVYRLDPSERRSDGAVPGGRATAPLAVGRVPVVR